MRERAGRGTGLSKSRVISWLQCPKRLWLHAHKPEVVATSAASQALFALGHSVGEVAQRLHPEGVLITSQDDLSAALAETSARLQGGAPTLFEATFEHEGLLVRADILRRVGVRYRLCEVKASASVKPYQLHDVAIQAWVLSQSGIKLESAEIQYINTSFVYPGAEDYSGLFTRKVVDAEIHPFEQEVPKWVASARQTLSGSEPQRRTGKHCHEPFECSCFEYCSGQEPQSQYPLAILPHGGKVAQRLAAAGYNDVRQIPDGELISEAQERVRRVTKAGRAELADGSRAVLASLSWPRYYLDFETIGFAVPIWPGTRPYQQLPFQWSCHVEQRSGECEHVAFLDVSGKAPMTAFAESLVANLGTQGPVLAYNAAFEKGCIQELARMVPQHADRLLRLADRLVDLLAITRQHYYHPDMKGSWSLKAVLPTIAPELAYENLGVVQDGTEAQRTYLELIGCQLPDEVKKDKKRALERYCERDTFGLVTLARFLEGRQHSAVAGLRRTDSLRSGT